MMNADMSLEDEKKTPELEDVKVAEAEALAADALRAAEEARSAAAKLADLRASIQVPVKNEPQVDEEVAPTEDVVEPQEENAPDSNTEDAALTTEEIAAPEVSEPETSILVEPNADEADLPQKPAEVRKDIFSRLFDAMGMDNLCGTSSAQVYVDPMDNGIPVDFMSEADTVPVDEESIALNTIPGSTPEATGEGPSVSAPDTEMPVSVPEESLEAELPVAEETSEVATPVAEAATEEALEASKEVVEETSPVSEETAEGSVPVEEATKEETLPVAQEATPVSAVPDESTQESAPKEKETTETAPAVLEETVEEPAPLVEEVAEEASPVPQDTTTTAEVPAVEEVVEETTPVAEEISPVLSKDTPDVEQIPAEAEKVQVVTPEPIKTPTSQKEGVGELSVVKQTILLDRKRNKLLAKPDPFSGEVESLDFIACGNGDVACGAPTAFPNVDDDSLVEDTEVAVATSPIICGWGA